MIASHEGLARRPEGESQIRKNLNKNLVEEIFQDAVHRLLNRFLRISNRKVIKKKSMKCAAGYIDCFARNPEKI